MLHAVNRRKARLDAFRSPGEQVPLEDVVTSTVFGPLLFIDQAEASAAVSLMMSALGMSPPDWSGPAHLSLWPKRRTVDELRSSYVEPDAEIVDGEGNSLIVEVKWGAPLSRCELAAQWLSLKNEARAASRHLLVVLEPGRYRGAIDEDRKVIEGRCALPWPIHMVTWRRMADAFRVIGGDMRLNPGTRRWALAVHAFLRREDPRALGGWSSLDLVEVQEGGWSFARTLRPQPRPVPPLEWRYSEDWFKPAQLGETQWKMAR